MFKIPKVEKASFYIDQSMRAMQEYALKERLEIDKRFKNITTKKQPGAEIILNKRKDLELQKVRYLNESIDRKLKKLITSFPKFDKVEEIYIKLLNTSETPTKDVKDSLARLLWIRNEIDALTQKTEFKLKKAKTGETLGFLMKKHLGKINSYFRKEKNHFEILSKARNYLNKLPVFKAIHTLAIAGYPNVGKSTLMKKLTGSDVEIQNYPFTTKGLLFGYITHENSKLIQLIDTPGLLGRDKNNSIEERANIVLTSYSEEIIFVLDVTQTCGYSVEQQFKLLRKIHNLEKKILVYLSKTDMFDEESEEKLNEITSKLKKYKIFKDTKELKEQIISFALKNKKIDLTSIKTIK